MKKQLQSGSVRDASFGRNPIEETGDPGVAGRVDGDPGGDDGLVASKGARFRPNGHDADLRELAIGLLHQQRTTTINLKNYTRASTLSLQG